MKGKIQEIYQQSHQIYGAPKIAAVLHKNGEPISERTTGKYMREMGIRALWVRHWTHTTTSRENG
ncbi:IS3 family transposase [Lachnoclostridium sp. Marseille-P6806]|uniref:IS3 family transposase n=1 Tax=Lachnoclostridium sp. Marseille-P6806 TaxID=2364793 RepID=UPI001A91AFEE|nr:IS3 family transposase [Lachnoclostridium sp. Marseille-P6806]